MQKKKVCPKCGIPLEGTACPVCGEKTGAKEFIPLESSGFSRGNLRLLGILGGVVAVLAICALLLLTFGSQQPEESSSVSSVSEESSQVESSEVELPDSLLDE